MEPVTFPARDRLALHGLLTVPLGTTGPRPMVLLVHGGPWAQDHWGYDPTVQFLANRGYAVLQVNYRGSTGYGRDLLLAGTREFGRKMHDDLIDGVRWAVERGIADPKPCRDHGRELRRLRGAVRRCFHTRRVRCRRRSGRDLGYG